MMMCQYDNKLISTHTVTVILHPRNPLQAAGNILKQHISILVSKPVIDMLKVIQIDVKKCSLTAKLFRLPGARSSADTVFYLSHHK